MIQNNNPMTDPTFISRFNQFAQQFNQQNAQSPKMVVQQLLNSGQMTQAQFNQFSMFANQIMGRQN